MLCLVLKSAKLYSFKGAHFGFHLRDHLGVSFRIHLVSPRFVPTRENQTLHNRYYGVWLINMYYLLSYLMPLMLNSSNLLTFFSLVQILIASQFRRLKRWNLLCLFNTAFCFQNCSITYT